MGDVIRFDSCLTAPYGILSACVCLDEQLEKRLNALTKKTRCSKKFIAKEALTRYIEEEEQKQQENDLTMARWDEFQETGEPVSNKDMMKYFQS